MIVRITDFAKMELAFAILEPAVAIAPHSVPASMGTMTALDAPTTANANQMAPAPATQGFLDHSVPNELVPTCAATTASATTGPARATLTSRERIALSRTTGMVQAVTATAASSAPFNVSTRARESRRKMEFEMDTIASSNATTCVSLAALSTANQV